MVIDIDSFLAKYKDSDKKPKNAIVKAKKLDLSFQKDVEDKLSEIEKKTEDSDFDFLKKAYGEVKKFDEDLVNKFLWIDHKGEEVLKRLGDKYSEDFFTIVSGNVLVLEKNIESLISKIDSDLSNNYFSKVVTDFNEVNSKFNIFPKQFEESRSKLFLKIKDREIKINEKLKHFKLNKLNEIIRSIDSQALILKKSLFPGNIIKIEESIANLHHTLQRVPNLFLTDIVDLRINISRELMIAQKFLSNEYNVEFKMRENIIMTLFDKFHKENLNKDLDKVLIVYNEILLEFEALPEVYFKQKIQIYKQINNLYSLVSNLILESNVNRFHQTYSNSKILEEVREYLMHVFRSKKIDIRSLKKVALKLNSLPNRYGIEKKELGEKINFLFNLYKQNNLKFSKKKNKEELKKNEMLIKAIPLVSKKVNTTINSSTTPKVIDNSEKITSNIKKTRTMSIDTNNKPPFQKLDENAKSEINFYIKRLKETSDKTIVNNYYQKIMFYIKISKVSKEDKLKMIKGLNQLLLNKKLNKNTKK